MRVFRWKRVPKIRWSIEPSRRKDHWNSVADRRGRRRIKISWDFAPPSATRKQVAYVMVHRGEEMFLARVESNKFSHIPGETRLSPSLSLSLRFFDKGSTFKLQAHEARIKFVSRSSLPTSRVEISNKFDRCKSLLIIHTKRSSHTHLSVSSSRDGFETFAINCKQFFLFSLSLSRSTIKRPTPRIQESKSIPR